MNAWGAAWARTARSKGIQAIVLGWDPRVSGAPMAAAFAEGVGGALAVHALGMVPTPAVACVTREIQNAWGVVISGGSGPPAENGLRGFDQNGEKLGEADEAAIEQVFDSLAVEAVEIETRPLRIDSRGVQAYLSHINPVVLPDEFRMVVDCAHGAIAPYAPHILLGGSIQWLSMPEDGERINVNVGINHLDALRAAVREFRADVGVAFDGDGDRCLMVDPGGGLLDGDQMLWLLVQRRIEDKDVPRGVVGTELSNEGLSRALAKARIPFARAGVGDKFLSRKLRELEWDLGAEPSGHVVQRRVLPTGDGLLTSATVLSELLHRKPAERWAFRFVPWVVRAMNINAPAVVPLETCKRLLHTKNLLEQARGAELRLVVRWSGREPKLRLLVEGKTAAVAGEALNQLTDAARADLQAVSAEAPTSSGEHPSSSLGPFSS